MRTRSQQVPRDFQGGHRLFPRYRRKVVEETLKRAASGHSASKANRSRIGPMAHRITRERMIEAIRELPEDASVDDAIERLVFLAKIEEGLAQLDRGEGIPHDEVKRRLSL